MFQTTNQNVIDMVHLWEISGDFFGIQYGILNHDFTGFIWIFRYFLVIYVMAGWNMDHSNR